MGPLLQRDYWAVIESCRLTPAEVVTLLRERFTAFPPEDLIRFRTSGTEDRTLELGDELEIDMGPGGRAAVRVVRLEDQSITLGTIEGHPEAGRITFGAYRNQRDDVIFHIRSRARSSSVLRYVGFLIAGDPMQTNTWTDFINRLAFTVGEGIVGAIQTEVRTLDDEDGLDVITSPTFIATDD